MNNNQIKPPIGTANTGYEFKVAVKPPFGEALVTELNKLENKNKSKIKLDADTGEDEKSVEKLKVDDFSSQL